MNSLLRIVVATANLSIIGLLAGIAWLSFSVPEDLGDAAMITAMSTLLIAADLILWGKLDGKLLKTPQ
jgi:hypothetical protein